MKKWKSKIEKIESEIDAMAEAGFHLDDGFPCCCDMESVKTLGFTTNPSGYLNDSVLYSLLYTTCSSNLPIDLCPHILVEITGMLLSCFFMKKLCTNFASIAYTVVEVL